MNNLEKQVIELHSQGLIDTKIAKIIKRSSDQVAYYRKKHNLLNNRNNNLEINKEEVIKSLKLGETIYSIKKRLKVSATFIKRLAIINNIDTLIFNDMIEKRRLVKNNPFSDLNNKDVQYWLGFLAADGGIFENRVSLGLQEKDYNHIVKYANFIDPKLKIYKVTKTINNKLFIGYRTGFRSIETSDFLKSIGITPFKSLTLDYKLSMTNDFIRGVIDGDGYIRKNHKEVSIATGSEIFAKQLQDFIKNYYKLNCTVRKTKPNMYVVGVYGKNNVTIFLTELYENANTYLDRKYFNAMLNRNI